MDPFPAALKARALRLVVEFLGTLTVIPAPVNCATVPVAATPPEQFALLYSLTWVGLPPPAVPLTSGLRSLAGESGSVSVIVGSPGPSSAQVTLTATVAVEPPGLTV